MNRLLKISFLLFAVVLFSGATGSAFALPDASAAKIQRTDENRSPFDHPVNKASQFRIYHQGASTVYTLERLPVPSSPNDLQDDTEGISSAEAAVQKRATIYLHFCRTIDCSLTAKKLLFPFHFHL